MFDDTITAIATSIGEAGIAVIRISGDDAIKVADRCFSAAGKARLPLAEAPTHTIHFGWLMRGTRRIDEVLVSVLRAPRTFTREDVVEISCHGGAISARMVLETVLANGARLAEPGEFTRRAFLNGRMDLTQAEAVADLIHARSELAVQAATAQLSGGLSSRLREIRDELIDPLAHLEAHIDFPDEDIAPDTRIEMGLKLDRALCRIDALLKTSREGQILRNGIRTVIVGRPNSGKSSLLNRLLGQDRAIVSPIPGTTRDTIEEVANIRGLPILFVDTAGLRIAESEIEEEGIRRTREVRDRAELILHVFDGSESLTDEDVKLLDESQDKPSIIVWNKIDLSHRAKLPSDINAPLVEISCLTGQGIEALKDAIKDVVWSGAIEAEAVDATINARHQEALRRAREGTLLAKGSLDRVESMEFVAMELRIAIGALGEITGQTTTEDLLDQIFSRFCIGK